MEAGYQCGIPACRLRPVEIHHIDSDRTNHDFDNLILLCRNHHGLADDGVIPQREVRLYKRNLGFFTGRYADLERRLLELFAADPKLYAMDFPRDMAFEFFHLLQDELITADVPEIHMRSGNFVQGIFTYRLTDAGKTFVKRWKAGQEIGP
jgi:hypothetical protein